MSEDEILFDFYIDRILNFKLKIKFSFFHGLCNCNLVSNDTFVTNTFLDQKLFRIVYNVVSFRGKNYPLFETRWLLLLRWAMWPFVFFVSYSDNWFAGHFRDVEAFTNLEKISLSWLIVSINIFNRLFLW